LLGDEKRWEVCAEADKLMFIFFWLEVVVGGTKVGDRGMYQEWKLDILFI
jgi:hypothetical protein